MSQILDKLQSIEKWTMIQALSTKKVLTIQEAAVYTDYELNTLYNLVSKKLIPHSKPNKSKVFFDRVELETWMLSNKIRTQVDIDAEAASYILKNRRK